MSLVNLIFDDPFGYSQDWFTDPLRETFRGQATSSDVFKPVSPLLTADIIETHDEFKVAVDLPGVLPEDIDLSIHEKSLLIKAERKHTHDPDNDKTLRLERSYGKVQRKIRLPRSANIEEAKPCFKNGVLLVCIPKISEEALVPKKLDITIEK